MRIFFLSLFFISNLCLVGCNKATQQLSEKSAIPSQNQIDSNKLGSQDFSKDISGRWIWQAKKDNKVIGMGEFEWKEEKSKIRGVTKTIIPGLKAIPGRGGNPNVAAAIIVLPLNGVREGNQIKFTLTDDKGNKTSNEASIEKQGLVLNGKSKQEISLDEADEAKLKTLKGKDNKTVIMEYDWTAVKISNGSIPKNPTKTQPAK
jgi:hypothetical protein